LAEGIDEFLEKDLRKDVSRLRSEVRDLSKSKGAMAFNGGFFPQMSPYQEIEKMTNPFTGIVSGNYWSQTGR